MIAIISVTISTKKDNKIKNMLKKNLNQRGFICSESLEIPDSLNQEKPMTFMVDLNSKKWVLAAFRAENSEIYDFSYIEDYIVTYREKSDNIKKGSSISISALKHKENNNNSVIETYKLSSNNCEYIEIFLKLKEHAMHGNIHPRIILFEKQDRFINAKNNDFLVPEVCINNAKSFENRLYYIISSNSKE